MVGVVDTCFKGENDDIKTTQVEDKILWRPTFDGEQLPLEDDL